MSKGLLERWIKRISELGGTQSRKKSQGHQNQSFHLVSHAIKRPSPLAVQLKNLKLEDPLK